MSVDIYGNALMYNGTNWATAGNVIPAGIDGSQIYVSCPSASFCAVVTGDGSAVTYNGQSWSAPAPIALDIDDVSCVSSTFCVAPDGHDVVSYNGTNWQTSATVDPDGYVTRVSCVSTAFCAATDTTGEASIYNGASWSTPKDVDATEGMLALACSSLDFCLAVDNDGNSLTYNGHAWSSPTAIGTSDPFIGNNALSCPTSQFCAAASPNGNVLTYDGHGWSAPNAIDPPVGVDDADLDGVSCPTAGSCLAVDQDGNAFAFDGSSWSAARSIDPIVGFLSSVSCASSIFCLAVDTFGYVLTYDGSTWSAPTEIDPLQLWSGNALDSVSCAPGNQIFCVVLDDANQSVTYNGSVWSAPVADQGMGTVSCPTTSFCMAVGSGEARTYNGTSWSAPTTVPSGTDAVSCAGKSFCMASDGDAVLTYDGNGWSGPTIVDVAGNYVTAVCSSVTFCMATDSAGNAFTYNGTKWSSPAAVDTVVGDLNGLSCPSASFCLAVDGGGNSFTYDGTVWSGPTVMDPDDFGINGNGVSCASAAFCMVVDGSSKVFAPDTNILPIPSVTSLSPNQGPSTSPDVVTISGTGFSTTPGATVIDFGAASPATGVSCSSTTTCTATPPTGTGTVEVTAMVQGRISLLDPPSDEFTYEPSGVTPTVTGLSPTTGLLSGGTVTTISGTGFSTTSGMTMIDFGSERPAADVSCSSATTCTATTPPGTGTVDVTATVEGLTSAINAPSDRFTYVPMLITTSSLPAGVRRVRYRAALSATGGHRPYKWSLISGALPTGVRLTSKGVLTGKPRVSGTFTFTVKVVDHANRPQTRKSATKTLSIVID